MQERRLEMEENRPKRSFGSISRKWALLVVVCVSPLLFLFHDEARGVAAAFSAGMIAVAVRYFWDLRNRMWFCATISFIALLHVPVILFVRWPFNQRYTYVQMLPVAFLDFALIYGVIRLAERVFEKV